jgi:hypothetical protein
VEYFSGVPLEYFASLLYVFLVALPTLSTYTGCSAVFDMILQTYLVFPVLDALFSDVLSAGSRMV